MSPVVLKIQHQMAIEHKELIDTEAGKRSYQLKEMETKHTKELEPAKVNSKRQFERVISHEDVGRSKKLT
jgi:hypothetical protein